MPGLAILRLAGANWKLLAFAATCMAVGFLWLRLQTVNAQLEARQADVRELQNINRSNMAEISRYKAEKRRNDAALIAEQERRYKVKSQLDELRREIATTPRNGCVGPAVHGLIDSLRNADADHKDQIR
jgi:septal ring factor EnvC (AmiA/AmiB activator)